MAERYTGNGSHINTDNTTVMNLFTTGTTRRPAIYEFAIGSRASAADEACTYQLERHTALGTQGDGFTPVALDPASPAASADFGLAHSGEPVYTANAVLYAISVNQRATYRWVAAPGSEFIIPATNNNGIGFVGTNPTSAFIAEITILFEE